MFPKIQKTTLKILRRVGIKAFFTLIIFSMIMSNGVGTIAAKAVAQEEASTASAAQTDISHEINLGNSKPTSNENVPILSEQIAKQAQQNQAERPVRFKVWAEPAIYTPGKPITLHWKVENMKSADLDTAAVVIHTPVGFTPTDPNPIYTSDGLVTISLTSKKDVSEWNVAEGAELPIYFGLDLLVNDDLIRSETVMVEQAKFSIDKNTGGNIKGMNGNVEVDVPASALDESLDFDIRNPAPNTQPGVSLTWQPVEIIAVGKNSKKNIDKFKAPIKIKVKYSEDQILVSPHLKVVSLPIVGPVEAWQSKVYRAVWGFSNGMAEL